MSIAIDQAAGLSPRRSSTLAARAIGRCLMGIGPIDRLLAIVDGHSDDLDGRGPSDTLARLVTVFGWGTLDRQTLEVTGLRSVTPEDLAAARHCGGALKPVISATIDAAGVEAFVGPAFLSSSQPLANLEPGLNGIRLDGRHGSNVFLSGPDIGLDVPAVHHTRPIVTRSAVTSWFARVSFPGMVPPRDACASLIGAIGISVEGNADYAFGNSRWLLIGSHSRAEIDAAAHRLCAMHRIETVMFRRITNL